MAVATGFRTVSARPSVKLITPHGHCNGHLMPPDPAPMTLPNMRALRCERCGPLGADVRPNWQERAAVCSENAVRRLFQFVQVMATIRRPSSFSYPRTGNPERPRRCVYRKLKPARNRNEVRQGWGASWCADVRRFLRPINTDEVIGTHTCFESESPYTAFCTAPTHAGGL